MLDMAEFPKSLTVRGARGPHSRGHAVVLGGSIAGLLAARVLADYYEHVTLVERDAFPAIGAQRKGVPQGRHAHALLASGRRALEALLPGISAELIAHGAMAGDAGLARSWAAGEWLAPCESGLDSLLATRPLLEGQVRVRLLQQPNVYVRERCAATGLIAESGRIAAVTIAEQGRAGGEETLAADLIVDASGRGSKLPCWLSELGFERPAEETHELRVCYTTYVCRCEDHPVNGARAVVISPHPPRLRGGLALAVEGDRWVITLVGYAGEHAPRDRAGFLEYAASLSAPAIYDLLRTAEPREEYVSFTYRRTQRRRYERLANPPPGVLAMGDALCSFNPIFGQGMSVAALEAQALDRCLAAGAHERLPRAFYRAAAQVVGPAWFIAAAADRHFMRAPGRGLAGLAHKTLAAYALRLQRAGARDPAAASALLHVQHLVNSPISLLAPRNIWRALRYGGKAAPRESSPYIQGPAGPPLRALTEGVDSDRRGSGVEVGPPTM